MKRICLVLVLILILLSCSVGLCENDKIVWKPLWGIDKYTETELDELSPNNVFDRVTIMWLLVEELKAIKSKIIDQQKEIDELKSKIIELEIIAEYEIVQDEKVEK